MKLKIVNAFFLLHFAFSMEAPDHPSSDNGRSYIPGPLSTARFYTSSFDHEATINIIHNPERYFTLDPTSPVPLIRQYIEQAKLIYQARRLHAEDQKTFLEALQRQAHALNNVKLETLHPWFEGFEDDHIIDLLEFNINAYQVKLNSIDNLFEMLNEPNISFDHLFENYMVHRIARITLRQERKVEKLYPVPSTIPSDFEALCPYDKFLSLEAILDYRIIDEELYALFPYISQRCFDEVNEQNQEDLPINEGWLIRQDYGFMLFLAGQISIPLDPDSTLNFWPQSSKDFKLTSVYNRSTRKHQDLYIPNIPKEYTKLFNTLRNRLAPKPQNKLAARSSLDESFLPPEVKRSQRHAQQTAKKQKRKAIAKKQTVNHKNTEQFPDLNKVAEAVEEITKAGSVPSISLPLTSSAPLPAKPKTKLASPTLPRPIIPQAGWSLKDQQRSAQARIKQEREIGTACPEATATEFQPREPIILSSGQYQTLQALLDENTPAYTITYERVENLLKGIGIKVEKRGGSHVHIHTPGQNIKILVNIHYSWTDKYGPGTMKVLRLLMKNLSLDNPSFVHMAS